MGICVQGDFKVDNCGYPSEVYSIDEACQRVYFILSTTRGSFIYNRNFGADFSPLLNSNSNEQDINKLAELLCREAVSEQKEISVGKVYFESLDDSSHKLSVEVLFDNQSKIVEVYI